MYNTLQSVFVVWDAILLTKVIRYKIYMGLYNSGWIGNVLAGELCPSCV